jgi:hypothetical protein
MKTFLPILLCVAGMSLSTLNAQSDTLLYEGFENTDGSTWGIFPFGNDSIWINLDEDGIPPNGGDPIEVAWYIAQEFRNPIDSVTNDTNYVANSLSWLEGSVPGNRNWLITPPIFVPNASAVLSWQSATFQLPRYTDGYTVLVSPTGSNEVLSNVFTDTLFSAASMTEIVGDQNDLDPANYSFSSGYIHGDYLNTWDKDWVYYILTSDSSLCYGLLEPHSVSLSAYAGKTIYIAFLHDSDDDFYLELDDILVRANTVGTNDPNDFVMNVQTYPNPVVHMLNLNFTLPKGAQNIRAFVTNMEGKTVLRTQLGSRATGQYSENFPMSVLPRGAYQFHLDVDNHIISKSFIKR